MRALLVGMALGSGLASLSFVIGMQISNSTDDQLLILSTDRGGDGQVVLIEAAGKCVGHFRAETTSHMFEISYAMNDLSKADIACLIEKSGPIRRDIFMRTRA